MDNVLKKKPVNMEDMQAYTRILSNLGIVSEGVCSTAADTAAKTVTLGATFSLENKATILVTFTNGISVANSTLAVTHTNIAGTEITETAKPIYLNGAALGANIIPAGATIILRYNGTLFDVIGGAGGKNYTEGDGIDITNDEISADSTIPRIANSGQSVILPEYVPGIFIGTCSTAADTAAKTLDIDGYGLVRKGGVAITFTNGISVANATLNISSKGVKPIYYRGAALAAGIVRAGDIVTMVYDGTQYVIISIESVPVYKRVYKEVSNPTGNPVTNGWYELSNGEYVLSEDTTVTSGKTYYILTNYYSMTI